jgi:hypothetical protein
LRGLGGDRVWADGRGGGLGVGQKNKL